MVRKINLRRHAAVLAIVLLVFAIGIFIGMRQGFDSVQMLAQDYESISMSSAMMDTLYLMEDSGMNASESCEAYSNLFQRFGTEIAEFNHRMWVLEEALGKDDPSLISLKDKFNTLEVRNYLLLKKVDKICGENHTVILYFYSNDNYDPKRDQGKIIQETIKEDKTIVYHFDTDISNPTIEMLIKKHGVFQVPSMVIENKTYHGYYGKNDLEKILE